MITGIITTYWIRKHGNRNMNDIALISIFVPHSKLYIHVDILFLHWPFRFIFFHRFSFCRRSFFLLLRNSIFAGFITIITCNGLFALFHNFSEAWLAICYWTAIFQPLTVSSFSKTEQGIQKYSLHLKQVYFVFFRHEEQDCSSFPAIFSNVIFCAWQLPKN